MLKKTIRRQVLIPLTLTFVILVGSFLYASYRIRLQDYETRLTARYQRVQNVLQSLVHSRTNTMRSIADFVAEKQGLQIAMQGADRSALLEQGTALLERLSKQQRITHFYFYDESGTIFLRTYQPENLTESPHRFTMRRAMAEAVPVAGLELGGNGTFTLRLVYPWHVDETLIGYIELGQEIDPILRELKDITAIDFMVVINKAFLDQQSWETGMTMLGRQPDWNLLKEQVLIDSTLAMEPTDVMTFFSDRALYQTHGSVIQLDGRNYLGRTFPLEDVAERTVGDFVLLDDLTTNVAAFRLFVSRTIAFSLLLSGVIFVFAYRILGRVDERLADSQLCLRQQFDSQKRMTEQLTREVAERRRAEEDLTRLNESLEQRVQERTSELQNLNHEIEASRLALEVAYRDLQDQQATILQQDKMACIGQLAAGVAHDINNPIGFVVGNLEVLQDFWQKINVFVASQQALLDRCASADELEELTQLRQKLKIDYVISELPQMLQECFDGTDRVNRIVVNLKGFSRADEPSAQQADINECLESTVGIVANELRYKADVVKDYGDLPPLLCYPQQLNQVFMNLLINAAQAIERWGRISITTRAEESGIRVVISDSGSGIADENVKRIFEPFFTTKAQGVGTGLGLSIVYDIVSKHRGEISVSSEVGKGTVFTLWFPFDGVESAHV